MKKIISLVAMLGMFALMSFGMKSEILPVDCWTMAEYNANVVLNNGGTQEEADETFYDSFEDCANDQDGVPTVYLK